ncbi:hypothetical protein ACIA8M_37085 [Streptomyces anulatus]|uniref:hypothetical protein n=1 Tax=Streptomyces anulatus TaxID=1892 RepID=UPI00225262C5|nr:hypothetical protein [Streptomyces anulatus]MCX4508156.1 hypothetical protein [Streptomyces anulatus]
MKAAVRPGSGGCRISSAAGFSHWGAGRSAPELTEPFTFVVGTDGALRLAPRRSEHVACDGGDMVLGAGEISFVRENDFVCVFRDSDLPEAWNVDPPV